MGAAEGPGRASSPADLGAKPCPRFGGGCCRPGGGGGVSYASPGGSVPRVAADAVAWVSPWVTSPLVPGLVAPRGATALGPSVGPLTPHGCCRGRRTPAKPLRGSLTRGDPGPGKSSTSRGCCSQVGRWVWRCLGPRLARALPSWPGCCRPPDPGPHPSVQLCLSRMLPLPAGRRTGSCLLFLVLCIKDDGYGCRPGCSHGPFSPEAQQRPAGVEGTGVSAELRGAASAIVV